jgi:hypothetical protein
LKGGQQAVHLSGPGGQLFFQGRDAGNRYDPLLQIRFQLLAQGRALGPHVLDQRREGLPRLLLILSQTAGQRFDLGEFLAQQTDVGLQLDQLRGLRLEAAGYQVTVTELVGWEHSMKNELIVAQFKNRPRAAAQARLDALLATFGLTGLRERFA